MSTPWETEEDEPDAVSGLGCEFIFESTQQLESGSFELLRVVGIAEPEVAYARQHDGDALLERLRAAAAFPVTDPTRRALVLDQETRG